MTRVEFLDKAKEQINGSRVTDYGKPENNFGAIAGLWSAYLGIDISAVDATMMMSLLKIARVKSGHGGTEDCFVDLAGYAACGGEIVSNKKSGGIVPAPKELKTGKNFFELIGDDPVKEPKITCMNDDFPKAYPTSWSNRAIVDGLIHEGWNYDTWLGIVKRRGEADWRDFITTYDDEYKTSILIDKTTNHLINYRSTEDVIKWGREYDKKQKDKNSN